MAHAPLTGLRRLARNWLVMLVCAASVVALAACSSGTENPAGGPAKAFPPMKVAYLPAVDFSPLLLADQLGFFKAAGLDVTPVKYTVGSTLVPATLAGDVQGTISSTGSLAIAAAQKLPLVLTNVFDRVGTDASKDTIQLLVPGGSPITSLAQLDGKTVGVNTTNNLSEIQIAEILAKAGVKAKYVTVPFSNQAAALRSGAVDAVSAAEPFITQIRQQQPVRRLAGSNVDFFPQMPLGIFVMSKQFVAENPEAATAFMQALDKGIRYAAQHPEAVRALLPAMTGVAPDVAAACELPDFSGSDRIDVAKLDRLAAIEKNYGLMDNVPDMSAVIADVAKSKVGSA